jgi:integrase
MFDAGGLYLELSPAGGKWWRLKYRHSGKEKRLSLGTYPDTGLADARERRDAARKLLAAGVDPSEQRRAEKSAGANRAANSFEVITREWLQKQSGKLAPITHTKATALFETWAFPWIGARPISEITPRILLESVLRRVESAGKLETVHRLKQRCGQVFRYAIATGRAERDPTPDLRGALETHKPRNHSAVTDPAKIGELLCAMDGYRGSFTTRSALRLTPLVFVRPGELRRAEWTEFDLEAEHPQWSIPAAKMKMDAPHIVPLSEQAIAILRELHPLTGSGQYVFPGVHSRARPMSENTVNVALRRLGYSGSEIVAHGFRSMASTLLNEQGWPPDVIERQLAHSERNEVRRAYNRAKHLPERRKMMQAWADYLDTLRRHERKIVPLFRTA